MYTLLIIASSIIYSISPDHFSTPFLALSYYYVSLSPYHFYLISLHHTTFCPQTFSHNSSTFFKFLCEAHPLYPFNTSGTPIPSNVPILALKDTGTHLREVLSVISNYLEIIYRNICVVKDQGISIVPNLLP